MLLPEKALAALKNPDLRRRKAAARSIGLAGLRFAPRWNRKPPKPPILAEVCSSLFLRAGFLKLSLSSSKQALLTVDGGFLKPRFRKPRAQLTRLHAQSESRPSLSMRLLNPSQAPYGHGILPCRQVVCSLATLLNTVFLRAAPILDKRSNPPMRSKPRSAKSVPRSPPERSFNQRLSQNDPIIQSLETIYQW